jgi:AcrR family transcriptional regulator
MTISDEIKTVRKELILEHAERLFYERGYRGTSMEAVADALSVTKPVLYAVYDRKLDILIDISLRVLNRSIDALRQARRIDGSRTHQLREFARRFTDAVIRHQAGSAVFFREEAFIPPEATLEINHLKGCFDAELAELIEAGVASGEFSVDDVRSASLAIGGMISWIYIWYRPDGRLSPEAIGDLMATYTLRLVGAPAGSS